ncbi:MAG: hypothetical protein A4E53_01804 [Pelotomaculum sp. PtaB.Bin104]|nr:MAG: hypothetical protein A4E53_01804 [Pelotomaculum sp. PtaB.Bin104]
MDNSVRDVLSKYIREKDGTKYFTGDSNVRDDLSAAEILAKACPVYQDDVEEESFLEDALTCYNCRFRRWARSGFSCYKGFPVS